MILAGNHVHGAGCVKTAKKHVDFANKVNHLFEPNNTDGRYRVLYGS